eukprot:TRINITY_DN71925_c0_g1_i1.p1 TRINITY_DN71925_c0_g1~~TRINITY_DN71925_c0_g1_i1.p1  ORF type:complete len:567 (+),score=143.34 TRINITY_DN71925_c0_g1_i1:167-1867(+)
MDGIGDAASTLVRHSISGLATAADELAKQASALVDKDPLAWLAGEEDERDAMEAGEPIDGPPPVLIPVPLSALQPWSMTWATGGAASSSSSYVAVPDVEYPGFVGGEAACSSSGSRSRPPPWEPDAELNSKVFLWEGDLCALEVDALIVPTASGYASGASTVCDRVLRCGGKDLRDELRYLDPCRSGEARSCKAYTMPCQRLVLTVGPKYKEKYLIAAQNTLNGCYRESMQLLVEDEMRTVAMPCIWYSKGYPTEEQAHVALRSVRRCLEKLRASVDALVFVAKTPDEMDLFASLMPLYFPRTGLEAEAAARDLPDSCWNEWGEVTVEERKIRVASSSFAAPCEDTDHFAEPIFESRDDKGFLDARGDSDSAALRRLEGTMREAGDEGEARHAFLRYYRRARELPTEPPDRRWVYKPDKSASSSSSSLGTARRVVVLLGARLPSLGVRDERTLSLLVKELEVLQGERFALLYVNSGVDALDSTKMEVLQEMLVVISARYIQHMDALIVLHPGLWFRAAFAVGQAVCPLTARAWQETIYSETVHDLLCYGLVPDRLELPEFVRSWEA